MSMGRIFFSKKSSCSRGSSAASARRADSAASVQSSNRQCAKLLERRRFIGNAENRTWTANGPFTAPPSPERASHPSRIALLGLKRGFRRPFAPFPRVGTPRRRSGTPFRRVGTPFRRSGTLCRCVGTPFRRSGTLRRSVGTTFRGAGMAFQGSGATFRRVGRVLTAAVRSQLLSQQTAGRIARCVTPPAPSAAASTSR